MSIAQAKDKDSLCNIALIIYGVGQAVLLGTALTAPNGRAHNGFHVSNEIGVCLALLLCPAAIIWAWGNFHLNFMM